MADLEYAAAARTPPRSPRDQSPRGRSPERSPREKESRRERSPRRSVSPSVRNPGTVLYVSGLSSSTRDDDLLSKFTKYGKIHECKIIKDPRTGDSRGFAFVTFDTHEQSEDAIAGVNHIELDGRTITVEAAKRAKPRSPTPGQYLGRSKGGPSSRSGGSYSSYGRAYPSYYERERYPYAMDRDRDSYRSYGYAPYRARSRSPPYRSPYERPYDRRSPYSSSRRSPYSSSRRSPYSSSRRSPYSSSRRSPYR